MDTIESLPIRLPKPASKINWGALFGCAKSLSVFNAAKSHQGVVLLITPDQKSANQLEDELQFIDTNNSLEILNFPDWETLPYDHFSPHQDIISDRLETLSRLPLLQTGILLVSVTTLMHLITPRNYLSQYGLLLKTKQPLDLEKFRLELETYGYHNVSQVFEHGEYSIRGSIIDIFPMGSETPYRIDLFDVEIDSIRTFDPDTQRSIEKIETIKLLPAKEFPSTEKAIDLFSENFRDQFDVNPLKCPIYKDVNAGLIFPGIEYYLPLFFEETATLFDYLPDNALVIQYEDIHAPAEKFWADIKERYNQLSHNITHPILPPEKLFISNEPLFAKLNSLTQISINTEELKEKTGHYNFQTKPLPDLSINHQIKAPLMKLNAFIIDHPRLPILFSVDSLGRREALLKVLETLNIKPTQFSTWEGSTSHFDFGIIVSPLEHGFYCHQFALITEQHLSGQRISQQRRRKKTEKDYAETVIKNLVELNIGDPVVHLDHGVGRYLGLQTLNVGDIVDEYLTLEYANQTKLYVPVSSLDLISRYSGADPEHAPLHKLGSDRWEKAKQKAAERVRDVAAELLDIYARREAKKGFAFQNPDNEYFLFADAFPFEETPDQITAINQTIEDMTSPKPMDRLVCGDVGFGKTEVAMRAAFIAVQNNKQVAILVPTTLLAQQHYETFKDRFADWPVTIDVLSRFQSTKQQKQIIQKLSEGKIDLIIGTHKLIQPEIKFHDLGLLVIDEEHRFGVRQKEKIKSLRAEIDILTLTATPIPRTLNMSISGIRDLSIIATPPEKRLSIKTFLQERNDELIKEAISRELMRGGQVFFLHNKVETINRISHELQTLVPEARVGIAHGQMHERELEQAMSQFYQRQFNVLVCTTIIENGIDIPSANTIIIDRADKFGLAQLHQLRGRVGRSHHQAYAYLFIPSKELITRDALKRLDAIETLDDLGIGFTLATHDLEIRGTGELLGEEQSGHIQEVGFSLYMQMLNRAVKSLKAGKKLELEKPLGHGIEVNLGISALIPEDYLHDIHARLILYKRIASAKDSHELSELRVEMIDRFGLLPEPTMNLFEIAELKQLAEKIGIKKIEANNEFGVMEFDEKPNIDPSLIIHLIQHHPKHFQLKGHSRLRFKMKETESRIENVRSALARFC